jgi:hypothetical protein
MNPHADPDRVFPLDAPARLEAFRAARLAGAVKPAPTSIVMGNGAFIRSWAGRRMKASLGLTPRGRSS